MTKETPDPIDVHVGQRLRAARNIKDVSQQTLGEHLGVSFQQVQKYEKGTNRVSCSMLQHICECLDVPASYFFEGLKGQNKPTTVPDWLAQFVKRGDGRKMAAAFGSIADDVIRRHILAMAEDAAELDAASRQPRSRK